MDPDIALRVVSLAVVLACTETLHGIARTVLVVPRIGKERALRLSVVSGSLLALLVCVALVPGTGLRTSSDLLAVGLGLAFLGVAPWLAMTLRARA